MYPVLLLLFLSFGVLIKPHSAEDCKSIEEKCRNESEYSSYRDCIRKRLKRSTECSTIEVPDCKGDDCAADCEDCDCTLCAFTTSCARTCSPSCCSKPNPCPDRRCCVKSCHAACRSSSCRTECKNSCTESIGQKIAHVTTTGKGRNITTTINLFNYVNASSSEKVSPTTTTTTAPSKEDPVDETSDEDVNYEDGEDDEDDKKTKNENTKQTTSHEKIDEEHPDGSEDVENETDYEGEGSSTITTEIINKTLSENNSTVLEEGCCYINGPQQCVPSVEPPHIKCFHVRRKECGDICKTLIVPQPLPPPPPPCVPIPTWPYISCISPQPPSCPHNIPFPQYPYYPQYPIYPQYNIPYQQPPTIGCPNNNCYDNSYNTYYPQPSPLCHNALICDPPTPNLNPLQQPITQHEETLWNDHKEDTKSTTVDNITQNLEAPQIYHFNPNHALPYPSPSSWQYNTFGPWLSPPVYLDNIPKDVHIEAAVVQPHHATITIEADKIPKVQERKEHLIEAIMSKRESKIEKNEDGVKNENSVVNESKSSVL